MPKALSFRDVPLALTMLLLAVGVLGFWYWPTWMDYRTGKLALLEVGLLAMVAGLSRSWPLRLLLWWGLLGVLMVYNWRSLVTVWRLFLAVAGIELIASIKRESLSKLLIGWRVMTILHTSLMLLQLLGFEVLRYIFVVNFHGQPPGLVTGLMDSTTLAGAYTAMTLPLFLSGQWRLWLLPSLLAVAAAHSMGALAIAAILLMTWGVCHAPVRHRRLAILSGIALSLALVVSPPVQAKLKVESQNRWVVWRQTGHLIKKTPQHFLMGYGPGQYFREFRRRAVPTLPDYLRWQVAHHEPLQAWFEFGLIGLGLCVAGVGRWLHAAWRHPDRNITIIGFIFAGWLLSGYYYFSAHVACLAVVGIVGAGLLEGARRHGNAQAPA